MTDNPNIQQAVQRLDSRVPAKQPPTVADMLQAVIEKGVSTENVAALESIVKLYERMEDRKAAKSASQSLRELQSEAKAIVATREVPDRNGGVRYKYVPYEQLMAQAQPLLTKYGFSVRYSQRMEQDRETVSCILTHDDGHAFSNEFTVRIGSGPPGATTTQADSSAGTVAQREAFCDALNIVRKRDDDANLLGDVISKEQAEELERRVAECNADRVAFLKFAGAKSFAEIGAVKYEMLDQLLRKKEKAGR